MPMILACVYTIYFKYKNVYIKNQEKWKIITYEKNMMLQYTCKFDTRCQTMRQEVMPAKFQPHASQMHLKWVEIRYCTQYAVYSNNMIQNEEK